MTPARGGVGRVGAGDWDFFFKFDFYIIPVLGRSEQIHR